MYLTWLTFWLFPPHDSDRAVHPFHNRSGTTDIPQYPPVESCPGSTPEEYGYPYP